MCAFELAIAPGSEQWSVEEATADTPYTANTLVTYDGSRSTLTRFLEQCVATLHPDPGAGDGAFLRSRNQFLRAGLDALRCRPAEWIQIGMHPCVTGDFFKLLRCITERVQELMQDDLIDDFFFMNKAPGLRLRFHPGSRSDRSIDDLLYADAERWRRAGLIDRVEPGVYESEDQLFGGPSSMAFVHSLFTIDSLLWLERRAEAPLEGGSPDWVLSLAVLQVIFDGLEIVGWEDRAVWTAIHELGRRLAPAALGQPAYRSIASEIRALWTDRTPVADRLDSDARQLLDRYSAALHEGARRWRLGFFSRRGATIGPRTAAAYFTVFHWNRAEFTPMRQALLVEALRTGGEGP